MIIIICMAEAHKGTNQEGVSIVLGITPTHRETEPCLKELIAMDFPLNYTNYIMGSRAYIMNWPFV